MHDGLSILVRRLTRDGDARCMLFQAGLCLAPFLLLTKDSAPLRPRYVVRPCASHAPYVRGTAGPDVHQLHLPLPAYNNSTGRPRAVLLGFTAFCARGLATRTCLNFHSFWCAAAVGRATVLSLRPF